MNPASRVAGRWLARQAASNTPEHGIIYTAIFLDPMDAQRLVKAFGQTHPTKLADHMTLWHFGEGTEPDLDLPWGKTIPLKVVGHVENDRVQTVVISPPPGFVHYGRTPHITISTAEDATPKESNDLLEDFVPGRGTALPTLRGRVGWGDSKGRAHFEPPRR